MKLFSCFTGVGGFEEGIHRAIPESECIGNSEIDKYASMVLKYKYPEVKQYGDIRRIEPDQLPDFDILCGGFPCQSFSIAGKRLGFNDTRGTLFHEIARIAKIKRPAVLFLENVKGLLNHQKGETFKVIIATLDELGYDAEWELLNSKYFGVPQNRERVFIIGHLRGQPWRPIFPIVHTDQEDTRTIGKEISYAIDANYARGDSPGTHGRRQLVSELKEITTGQSQGSRVYDTDGITVTIASQAGGLGAKTGLYAIKQPSYGEFTQGDICDTLTKEGKSSQQMVAIPVLTPDRVNKRQNGRRMKDDGEDMFTLTAQDKHGVIVHSLQTRSEDRPSLKKNPKGGGSGHIQKEDETYCLDTGNTQGIEQEQRIRRLTPRETERLQGFPDDWTLYGIDEKGEKVTISDSQRYKMMGNAVTVNVIAEIARRLKESMR